MYLLKNQQMPYINWISPSRAHVVVYKILLKFTQQRSTRFRYLILFILSVLSVSDLIWNVYFVIRLIRCTQCQRDCNLHNKHMNGWHFSRADILILKFIRQISTCYTTISNMKSDNGCMEEKNHISHCQDTPLKLFNSDSTFCEFMSLWF